MYNLEQSTQCIHCLESLQRKCQSKTPRHGQLHGESSENPNPI
uniref:Uncharacterized protein n=1 Tax=Arundo donax TaxID=35708 RepID=A0A0A9FS15_ARUDO